MTLIPISHALLSSAIDNADASTLRSALKSICESSLECRQEVSQRLLTPPTVSSWKHALQPEVIDDDDDDDDDDQQVPSKKQKTEGSTLGDLSEVAVASIKSIHYDTCSTCYKRFDITANEEDSCQLHDGDLEVNKEYFPHDADIQAGEEIDVNSDWRVDSHPQGFTWTCCEENANGPPCIVQRHIAS